MKTQSKEFKAKAKGVLAILRLNELYPIKSATRTWIVRNVKIKFEYRSADNLWGRFGGGWDWEFGFQASKGFHCVIVNLFVCSFRFSSAKDS